MTFHVFDKEEITALRQKQLEILEAVSHACSKLGITYFLWAGTLLGCVRHHGYIPWDDDLDIAMPCEDFYKFINEGGALLPNHIKIDWAGQNTGFSNGMAKVRDASTTYIEACDANKDATHGIFIDIFPIYKVPAKRIEKIRLAVLTKVAFSKCFRNDASRISKARKFPLKQELSNILVSWTFFFWSRKKALRKFHQYATKMSLKYPDAKLAYEGLSFRNAHFEFASLLPTKTAPYENTQCQIPEHPECYLTATYGDYMTPPPVEKQVGMHYCVGFSATTPYKEYIREHPELMKGQQ